jgi:hypothetical protein
MSAQGCDHGNAVEKRYVGSTDSYRYCPDCWATWGGEETQTKRALLSDAARLEELLSPEELDGLEPTIDPRRP